MSERRIGATFIHSGTATPLTDMVLVLDRDEKIVDMRRTQEFDRDTVEFYDGWIIPGFVNTHCHLELSHMKGLLPTGTGLIPFITGVVTQREAKNEIIQEAMHRADTSMWNDGIMAVGDISNTVDSFSIKAKSNIVYYNFVEAFDLMQPQDTEKSFNQSKQVYDQALGPKSLVPHAPYSCTPELLEKINTVNKGLKRTISIHNQETVHENDFFLSKTGQLIHFYESFGLSVSHLEPTSQSSIHYLLQHIDASQRYLFVHNTLTNLVDFQAAIDQLNEVYWTTCANANLYIENNLPDYKLFSDVAAAMTIGTDSLASNWQLSVWDELLTIKRYNSFLPNQMLLDWATINGARALHLEDRFGSIEIGKSPGLLHLNTRSSLDELIQDTIRPVRIV
jgi:cytosine/adenosine deaminase-related metal-dependent hydrolase